MLGHKTIQNIQSIASSKPSLFAQHYDGFVYAVLYIDKKSEYSNHEVIGTVSVEKQKQTINGQPVYQVIDTSGAYPGFGSLAYQCLLIELASRGENALLISDRESVTKDAEGIYNKLIASSDFEATPIPDEHNLFSWDIHNDDKQCNGHVLNHAYSWKGNELSAKYHKILVDNHESRNLSKADKEQLQEEAEFIGEWVENNHEELIELRNNNFIDLRTFSVKEDTFNL